MEKRAHQTTMRKPMRYRVISNHQAHKIRYKKKEILFLFLTPNIQINVYISAALYPASHTHVCHLMFIFVHCRLFIYLCAFFSFVYSCVPFHLCNTNGVYVAICGEYKNNRAYVSSIDRTRCRNEASAAAAVTAAVAAIKNTLVHDVADLLS